MLGFGRIYRWALVKTTRAIQLKPTTHLRSWPIRRSLPESSGGNLSKKWKNQGVRGLKDWIVIIYRGYEGAVRSV